MNTKDFTREILLRLRYIVAHTPDDELEETIRYVNRIREKLAVLAQQEAEEERQAQQQKEPPISGGISTPQQQVPNIARELWTLARGNPDTFTAYMLSYPDKSLNNIAANPSQLNALMHQINNTQSIPPQGHADGIPQAPLQSSNIYGLRYDPLKKTMTTRFQNGSVYKYENVPKIIFDMVFHGDGMAKTKGSNRWGRWWRFKKPSMGASFHELIKLGGYPFKKVR